MNIRALRLFVEIMDRLTLSRASEKLNISQPAASRLIRLLEEELGEPLFTRERKRLHPTPEAEALMPEAVRILQSIDNLPAVLAQSRRKEIAPLRVLCLPRIVDGLVLPVLARVHQEEQTRRFNVDVCPRREFGRRLLYGGYDVGVSSLPIPVEGLETRRLARAVLQVMVPRKNPLADRENLTIADLRTEQYIALNRHSAIRTAVDAALLRDGHGLEVTHEVSTSDVAYWFVRNGMGFTFADPASVTSEIRRDVALVPCNLDVGFEIAFFLPKAEKTHECLEPFMSQLVELSRSRYQDTGCG
ncbi:HTH-type transcriptional regulator CysL (plasmid) [Pseudosulfitobacter sp. DSM 107133]|nr:HTH-type transcriptional regulator CysL [Pseudosulfitobacter sp. DSM 107133]